MEILVNNRWTKLPTIVAENKENIFQKTINELCCDLAEYLT